VKEEEKREVLAYIGLGSNLGDGRENLLTAWARLGEVAGVKLLALSSPYETEPVGMVSENWFINAAGSIETSLEPGQLLAAMHEIEAFWGDRISEDAQLTLPHPEISNRLFVLEPLVEIAPDHKHSVSGKTMGLLLDTLRSQLRVHGQNPQINRTTWQDNNRRQGN